MYHAFSISWILSTFAQALANRFYFMNPRIFLFFCCFLTIRNGWTQSVEDIKTLLPTSSPNQKVELIIQLCDQFSLLNQGDSIKKYIQIAVPLANTIQNESAKAWVDHYLADRKSVV